MSATDEPGYTIGLKHLSADLKQAAANLPDLQLDNVPAKKLRALLKAFAALAPHVEYPAAPEMRLTTARDKFVVQVREKQLRLVSWSATQPAAGGLTADQIFTAITGEAVGREDDGRGRGTRSAGTAAPDNTVRNRIIIALCSVGIVLCNAFTVWLVTRPPRDRLPKYALLAPEPAERLLTSAVGAYETGGQPGDKRLQIRKDGSALLGKFGKDLKILDEKKFTVKGAQVAGRPSLITSRRSMIEIKDPVTLVLYGDTYRRVNQ
jgi:hypothetical protein